MQNEQRLLDNFYAITFFALKFIPNQHFKTFSDLEAKLQRKNKKNKSAKRAKNDLFRVLQGLAASLVPCICF